MRKKVSKERLNILTTKDIKRNIPFFHKKDIRSDFPLFIEALSFEDSLREQHGHILAYVELDGSVGYNFPSSQVRVPRLILDVNIIFCLFYVLQSRRG